MFSGFIEKQHRALVVNIEVKFGDNRLLKVKTAPIKS